MEILAACKQLEVSGLEEEFDELCYIAIEEEDFGVEEWGKEC